MGLPLDTVNLGSSCLTVQELRDRAEQYDVEATSGMTKEELLEAIGPEHRH